ncbi:Hypothetical predicted protein [Mytilus galloprovincialis]|uniref:Uncharacterized protein n=1 Tax=Mytilus galloprovincialis TaxID=29158 RepID=A0A8B6ESY5_MYTGA|nr:Hypothetical predicted protein [Mytilus galloprovincialis]
MTRMVRSAVRSVIAIRHRGPIEPTLLPNEKDTSNESTLTRNGAPDDWIIYTLCITSCFFVTGFGHLFRIYIKRRSQKVGIIKKKGIPEPFTSSIGDFNQEDKTPIQFVTTGSNVTPKASHEDTINFVCHERQSYITLDEDDEDGNFDLYFDMKEDVDHQVEHHALQKECLSTSSFNSIVVSQDKTEIDEPLSDYCQEDAHACEVSVTVHERQSYTACNEDDGVDEAGYFDLYFDMKEDVNHEVEHHALPHKSLSNNSFNSNVVSKDNTEFYEPLSGYCQEDAHACEVSVTVHERQSNIACNGDDEVEEAGYFYLYFDMKEDGNHQEQHHALPQKSLSNSSFNSKDVGQDDTEFLKPLSEYYQGDPDACEESLSVNQCIERSSLSKEDTASNVYVNVYQLLQNDRQKNS